MSTRTTYLTAPSTAAEPESPATAAPGLWRARFASLREQTWRLATSGIFVRVLAALLAIDAIFITLHVLRLLLFDPGVLDSKMFAITEDGGYGETFGYLQLAAITLCFLVCYFRDRMPVFLGLGIAFVVVALDDSLQIHERLGTWLVGVVALEPVAGLRAKDLGELIVWSALGAVVVSALAISFLRSDMLGRNIALIFGSLLAVLVFFAVGVDMVHMALKGAFRGAAAGLALLEDGGEMVTLSVIAAAAATLAWCGSSYLVRPGPSSRRPLR